MNQYPVYPAKTPAAGASAEAWITDLLNSDDAARWGFVASSRRDIESHAGMGYFQAELRRRGYRAVENSGRVVVFCNSGPVMPII